MARQTKARLDTKGLTGLGLEKLVEILLEESASNKALKARLQTALAGTSGPEEVVRLIDKRLDALEKAKTSIKSSRARDLTVELSGLLRNIQSELVTVDSFAAFERLMRLLALRHAIEQRLNVDSARLMKVFSDAQTAIAELASSLPEAAQVNAIPLLEKERGRDRYGEQIEFFGDLLCSLAKPAADAWQAILEGHVKSVDPARNSSRLLQRFFRQNGNLDAFIALEEAKPENRQDTFAVAQMLYQAGRQSEALDWIRRKAAGTRIIYIDKVAATVGPDYQAQERQLLEADILDGLKQRDAAQVLRWKVFLETFDPDVLRRYIARLDDFAEFDELDRAFAAARASKRIHEALLFLIEWPKLDLAAEHVLAHAGKWDGNEYEHLRPAAEALSENYPVAATLLYRVLLTHILDRGLSVAYEHAAHYMRTLAALSLRMPETLPFADHASFVGGLQSRHPRKFGFWQRVPMAGR